MGLFSFGKKKEAAPAPVEERKVDNGGVNVLGAEDIEVKWGKLLCPFCGKEINGGIPVLREEQVLTCPSCNAKMSIPLKELEEALEDD